MANKRKEQRPPLDSESKRKLNSRKRELELLIRRQTLNSSFSKNIIGTENDMIDQISEIASNDLE